MGLDIMIASLGKVAFHAADTAVGKYICFLMQGNLYQWNCLWRLTASSRLPCLTAVLSTDKLLQCSLLQYSPLNRFMILDSVVRY